MTDRAVRAGAHDDLPPSSRVRRLVSVKIKVKEGSGLRPGRGGAGWRTAWRRDFAAHPQLVDIQMPQDRQQPRAQIAVGAKALPARERTLGRILNQIVRPSMISRQRARISAKLREPGYDIRFETHPAGKSRVMCGSVSAGRARATAATRAAAAAHIAAAGCRKRRHAERGEHA